MELHNQTTEKTNWTAFIYGCIAGAVTCLAVFIYLFTSLGKANVEIPLFHVRRSHNIPCLLQQLCDKYVSAIQEDRTLEELSFGETVYVLLSLVAKAFGLAAFPWDSSTGLITLNKKGTTFKQTLSFSERGIGTLLFRQESGLTLYCFRDYESHKGNGNRCQSSPMRYCSSFQWRAGYLSCCCGGHLINLEFIGHLQNGGSF